MKNFLLLTAFIFSFLIVNAQQDPLYSQYLQNRYVLNPAFAGISDNWEVRSVARAQWAGIEGSPNTQTLSVNGKSSEKVGLGAYIFNDMIGPVTSNGINLTYAYYLNFSGDKRLSFGLSGIVGSYRLNTAKLSFDSNNSHDNVLSTGNFSYYYPNFTFGTVFSDKNYYVAFSVPELIQNKLSSSSDFYVMKQLRHYYLMGGYKHEFSDQFAIEPSVLAKYVQGAPAQVDVNIMTEIKKTFKVGLSYRSSNALVAIIGGRFKERYHFGYSFDFSFSNINRYTKGSHEIMLGIDFIKVKNVPSME